jgi:hypothetical protein
MSNEILLPVIYNDLENNYCNNISISKYIEVILFHIIFIIGDIYFTIYSYYNCNPPNIIINVTCYFAYYSAIEFIWTIYILNLIIQKKNIILNCNCDAYIFIIYHWFIFIWNIIGLFMISDLMNYSCNVGIYNYLFIKIIITYFYFFYKMFVIFY